MPKKNKPSQSNADSATERLEVLKTYKMYIDGKFPRSESGRYYTPTINRKTLANVCLASRKDLRNAVVAARDAQPAWCNRSAYNRSQILYRIAEMLEGRHEQFVSEIKQQGLSATRSENELTRTVDRLVYYAGWCDKYQQIFSSVNPIASSYFNFSVLEPTGVVFLVAREGSPLLALVSLLAPIIAAGNTCVALASHSKPLSAVTLGEVLHTSDLPAGVVNILTGNRDELASHFSKHLDINAIANDCADPAFQKLLDENAATNVKRIQHYDKDWSSANSENPYLILDFCEVKTTWHPIEGIGAGGSGY